MIKNSSNNIGKFLIAAGFTLLLNNPGIANAAGEDKINVYRTIGKDGYSQIVYEEGNNRKIITDDKWPHADPVTNNKAIVWSAQVGSLWQLFYYDIYSEQTIQLTKEGNNVDPQISGDVVVWEGQRGGVWQVLMFDGVRITRLTSGDYPAQDVVIKDNTIAYSQKNKDGTWHVYLFDITLQKTIKLTPDSTGRKPEIKDNLVIWQTTESESEETLYFTYDTKTNDTYYEKISGGRRTLGSDLVERIRSLGRRKAELEALREAKTTLKRVTVEDIRKEIDLDFEELAPETTDQTTMEEQVEVIEQEPVEESTESISGTETVQESTSTPIDPQAR